MPSRPVVGASGAKGSGNSEPPGGGTGKNRGARAVEPPPPAESGATMKTGERPVTEQLRTVRNLDKMTHLAALTRSDDASYRPSRGDPRPPEPDDQTQIMGPSSVAPLTEVHPTTIGEHHADIELESDDDLEPWPTQTSRRAAHAAKVEAERNASAGAAASPENPRDATLVADPEVAPLPTTQALRVVLYRTADGVRIAPAGTKIPAISIEAMLVALDPSVDLTAWLK